MSNMGDSTTTPLLLDHSSSIDDYGTDDAKLSENERAQTTEHPRPNACLVFFRIHGSLAAVSLSTLAITQVLPSPINLPALLSAILKGYLFIGCLCCMFIEVEFSQWFLNSVMPLMKNWIFRGLSYVFLGLVGTQEGTLTVRDYDDGYEQVLSKVGANLASCLLWLSSLGLIVSGILYAVMGLLLMDRLRDKYEREYVKQVALHDERYNSSSVTV